MNPLTVHQTQITNQKHDSVHVGTQTSITSRQDERGKNKTESRLIHENLSFFQELFASFYNYYNINSSVCSVCTLSMSRWRYSVWSLLSILKVFTWFLFLLFLFISWCWKVFNNLVLREIIFHYLFMSLMFEITHGGALNTAQEVLIILKREAEIIWTLHTDDDMWPSITPQNNH